MPTVGAGRPCRRRRDRLCVVPSRWDRGQLEDVRAQINEGSRAWGVYISGPRTGDDGQLSFVMDLVRIVPDLAAWAESLPDGLLHVIPWLAPDLD